MQNHAVFAMKGSIRLAKEDGSLCNASCNFETPSHVKEVRFVRVLSFQLWGDQRKEANIANGLTQAIKTCLPEKLITEKIDFFVLGNMLVDFHFCQELDKDSDTTDASVC